MAIKIWDKHNRPPIGTRVYVKEEHFMGTVVFHDFHKKEIFHVEPDTGGTGKNHMSIRGCKREDVQIIGPPDLIGACAVDTCPICEEDIRIRKGEE